MVLKGVYGDRYYARFFALETIARVPYFGEGSVSVICLQCSSLGKKMVPRPENGLDVGLYSWMNTSTP